jgi:enamine deaminase RidA (YjgF/YER057c/UK114 family)
VAMEVRHLNPEGLHKNPAFTQAVIVSGVARTVYIGGQNAVTPNGQIVGEDDLAAQAEQVFSNLSILLAAAGGRLHDIVKWTIYVVQGRDIRPAFGVFQRVWGVGQSPPAITVITVAGLADPAFLVEVEAIAVLGRGDRDE